MSLIVGYLNSAAAAPVNPPNSDTMGFVIGFFIVIVGAVIMAAMQAGALIGAMFGVNKLGADKFGDQHYGEVDLEHLDQRSLIKLIKQTIIITGIPTVVWFILFYVLYATYWVAWLNWLPRVLIWPLHGAAVFAGLHVMYKLDWRKSAILAGATLFAYIILFWLLVPDNLFR